MPTAQASASSGICIEKSAYDILISGNFAGLTPGQQAAIVAAVEGLAFAAGSREKAWQDFFLSETAAGRWTPLLIQSLKSGEVALQACP